MTWDFSTPLAIQQSYESGFVGAIADRDGFADLREEERRLFGASPLSAIAGSGEGKLSIPYVLVLKHVKDGFKVRQTAGDCTTQGGCTAALISAVCDFAMRGDREELMLPFANEVSYSTRPFSGEGWSCTDQARSICKGGKAGLLQRKAYPELGADFTVYDGKKGSRRTVPEKVLEEARKHQVESWHVIESLEEVRDLLANGYGVNVCSGYSFSNKRDEWGVSDRTREGWAHAMAWVGFDDRPEAHERYGDCLVCVDQSWGEWNSGGWLAAYGPMPQGAFWILGRHARGMLSGGGGIGFSTVNGWPARKMVWRF